MGINGNFLAAPNLLDSHDFYSTTDEADSADISLDYLSYPSNLCSNKLCVRIIVISGLIIYIR